MAQYAQTHHADSAGTISAGLNRRGMCPEYGAPAGLSLDAHLLRLASPRWVRRIRLGCWLTLGSHVLILMVPCGVAFLSRFPSEAENALAAASLTIALAGVLAGSWLIVTPEPSESLFARPREAGGAAEWHRSLRGLNCRITVPGHTGHSAQYPCRVARDVAGVKRADRHLVLALQHGCSIVPNRRARARCFVGRAAPGALRWNSRSRLGPHYPHPHRSFWRLAEQRSLGGTWHVAPSSSAGLRVSLIYLSYIFLLFRTAAVVSRECNAIS